MQYGDQHVRNNAVQVGDHVTDTTVHVGDHVRNNAVHYEHASLQCERPRVTPGEESYPRVVAWTCDNRLVQGRLVDDHVVLTTFLELVSVFHAFEDPYTQDMKPHPLFLPADCPVRATTTNGSVIRGFLKVETVTDERYVDSFDSSLDGGRRRVNLYELVEVVPELLAEVGVGFSELTRCDLKSYGLTSVSTSRAVWIVPSTFVEAQVDSWFSLSS